MTIRMRDIRRLMGQLVIVTKVSKRVQHLSGAKVYEPKAIAPRCGWVVGVRWYRDGRSEYESDVGYLFEGEGPAVPHLLVSFWPSQNPVKVPMDGWRRRSVLPERDNSDPLPWDGIWDEAERASARDLIADQRRDERGRFA